MNIIIDSNILFSALIKDSLTRRIILSFDGFFLFPVYIFEEIEKHKHELLKKSKMDEKSFEILLNILLRKVMIVPSSALDPYKKEAFEIIKTIDPDDVIFIACALAYSDSVLWSDDKKLKQQTRIPILSTSDLLTLIFCNK